MSVGRPRWTWRSTCSTACRSWDARSTSASPDPDGVGGSAPAPMIHAPRCIETLVLALTWLSDRVGPSLPPRRVGRVSHVVLLLRVLNLLFGRIQQPGDVFARDSTRNAGRHQPTFHPALGFGAIVHPLIN